MRGFAFIFILLFSVKTFANSEFIPNYYRNRKALNSYAAIGWSDRREVQAQSEYFTSTEDGNGVRAGDTTEVKPALQGYYRLDNGMNFEASANEGSVLTYTGGAGTKQTVQRYRANAGYEFSSAPIALGVSVLQNISDFTGSTHATSTTRNTTVQIGGGYRLPSNYYVGFGYQNAHPTGSSIGHYYTIGAGRVFGDPKAPSAAVEAILDLSNNYGAPDHALRVKGLYNHGSLQVYSDLRYDVSEAINRSANYLITAGLDYEFMGFYAGPQIDYTSLWFNDYTTQNQTTLSVEAGYRAEKFEAFLRYGNAKDRESFSGYDFDTRTHVYTAGFIYKF